MVRVTKTFIGIGVVACIVAGVLWFAKDVIVSASGPSVGRFPATQYDLLRESLTPELKALYVRSDAGHEPRVVLDPALVDFGSIQAGATVRGTFKIRNEGPGPLRILAIRARCGCTIANFTVHSISYKVGNAIESGAEALCEVEFRSSGFSGEKIVSIDVLTNDFSIAATAEKPCGALELRTRAMIRDFFEFSSGAPSIDMGEVSSVLGGIGKLTARSRDGSPFELVSVSDDPSKIEVKTSKSSTAGDSWVLEAVMKPGLPMGPFARIVRIPVQGKSSLPDAINLFVHGQVRGRVRVDPAAGVHFGVIRRGEPASRCVTLKVDPGAALRIGNLSLTTKNSRSSQDGSSGTHGTPAPSKDFIECEIEADAGPDKLSIRLHINESSPPGAFTRFLELTTGVSDGPDQISIPVTGFVR